MSSIFLFYLIGYPKMLEKILTSFLLSTFFILRFQLTGSVNTELSHQLSFSGSNLSVRHKAMNFICCIKFSFSDFPNLLGSREEYLTPRVSSF